MTDLMHTVTFGPAGSYPRSVCEAHKHGDRGWWWCGPRFVAEHCARLGLIPCPLCWAAPAQMTLELDGDA